MKDLQEMEEILFSWRKCMEKGLLSTRSSPALLLKDDALQTRLNENNLLMNIFEECVGKIVDLMPNKYIFLLTDGDGILLKKKVKRA